MKLNLPKFNLYLFICLFGLGIGFANFSQSQKASGLPRIGFSVGGFTGFTDIKSEDYKPGLNYKIAYQIYVDKPIIKPLSLGLNFITGKIYGSQTIQGYDINFQTTVFSQSLRLNYNFFPFIKAKAKNRFYPFVGVGIGMLAWRSKGDYKDQNGKFYSDYDSSQLVAKDHIFETDLRQANLDRFGKYPQVTMEIPVFLGVDIRIKKGLNARINAEYHVGFSDMLDNVSSKGLGARQGKKGYDNLLAISAGVNYNLAYAEEDDSKPQDLDLDGIVDSKDKCENTPAGVRVDKKGCPVDDNNNGTADYLEEGSMANQDYKNNQDPNKPNPFNSSETKSSSSESTTANSTIGNENGNENSAETAESSKGKKSSTVVSAQEEVDNNGRNEGSPSSITAESSGNRKQTTATMEEDGKEAISMENNPKTNTGDESANSDKVNTRKTDKETNAKTKGRRKQEGQMEEQVDGKGTVVDNSTSNGKVEENGKAKAEYQTTGTINNSEQSERDEIASQSQSNNQGANTENVAKENQKKDENKVIKQSNTIASSSESNNTVDGSLVESNSTNPSDRYSSNGKEEEKEIKQNEIKSKVEANNSKTKIKESNGEIGVKENSTEGKQANSNEVKGVKMDADENFSSSSKEGVQTNSDGVKVVKMDADEDFASNSKTSKNGIDLTDAKTAKAQFEKAAGASSGKNEPMSAVDLSARLGRFAFADINKNGKISVAEVNHFIDEFFENGEELNLKVSDIRDLIDFYFEQ